MFALWVTVVGPWVENEKFSDTPKLIRRLHTPCTIKRNRFKVKSSKVTRPINADIKSVSSSEWEGLPTSILGQMVHEDPYHKQAPWPPRLKVKVAGSRGPSESCWPIGLSQEQKVPETPKFVERLSTLRAITRTRFEIKRSKVKVN